MPLFNSRSSISHSETRSWSSKKSASRDRYVPVSGYNGGWALMEFGWIGSGIDQKARNWASEGLPCQGFQCLDATEANPPADPHHSLSPAGFVELAYHEFFAFAEIGAKRAVCGRSQQVHQDSGY